MVRLSQCLPEIFQMMQEMFHLSGLTGVDVVSGSTDASIIGKSYKDTQCEGDSQELRRLCSFSLGVPRNYQCNHQSDTFPHLPSDRSRNGGMLLRL